ncbi:hypothetical protein BBJ28_00007755 [Nothophytophthora sp. Chile5]|nr:hypothetical protein BBJ28_00007755 [Nothophytophthora sp. Chile5]
MAGTANASQAALDEDWEEWTPEKGSFVRHMLAGSAAGVAEHVSIFPIDTIKVREQTLRRRGMNGKPLKLSAMQTARKLVVEEGPLRLFRGVSTMLSASLPAHAVYFSVFESAKKALGADSSHLTPMASGTAGVIATVCHDLIMTPMDVMKHEGLRALYISFPTTLLMNLPYSINGRPGGYAGLLDALLQIKAQEGIPGFFRGVYPRLLVHAPSVAVSWTTFEVLKKTFDRWESD